MIVLRLEQFLFIMKQCVQNLLDISFKRQTKIAADDTLIFYFYLSKIKLDFSCESSACFSEKIRLGVSSESSARQRIHLKHQVLFSLKNNETRGP